MTTFILTAFTEVMIAFTAKVLSVINAALLHELRREARKINQGDFFALGSNLEDCLEKRQDRNLGIEVLFRRADGVFLLPLCHQQLLGAHAQWYCRESNWPRVSIMSLISPVQARSLSTTNL